MTKALHTLIALLLLAAGLSAQTVTQPTLRVPVRTITKLEGSMSNTVTGVGLVTGLNRTGATDRGARQALSQYLQDFGLVLPDTLLNPGAVAIVSVTAELPSFSHIGMDIDVTVSALTEVESLEGGVLQRTELVYFDGPSSITYAVASGSVSTGGFGYGASTTRVSRNNPAAGKIARGAKVVQSVSPELLSELGALELVLLQPSLQTADNIVRAARGALAGTGIHAEVHDQSLVRFLLPQTQRNRAGALRTLSLVGGLRVEVDHPRRVVIDVATATLVAGADVRISPCVVMNSSITVSVVDEQQVSQPGPFTFRGQGQTAIVNRSQTDVELQTSGVAELGDPQQGATVAELAETLHGLGLDTWQIIKVFEQLDEGGFLHAPLVIR